MTERAPRAKSNLFRDSRSLLRSLVDPESHKGLSTNKIKVPSNIAAVLFGFNAEERKKLEANGTAFVVVAGRSWTIGATGLREPLLPTTSDLTVYKNSVFNVKKYLREVGASGVDAEPYVKELDKLFQALPPGIQNEMRSQGFSPELAYVDAS